MAASSAVGVMPTIVEYDYAEAMLDRPLVDRRPAARIKQFQDAWRLGCVGDPYALGAGEVPVDVNLMWYSRWGFDDV